MKGCDNVQLRAGQTNEITCTVQAGVEAAGVPSEDSSQTTFTLVVTPKAGDSYSHTYRHTIR